MDCLPSIEKAEIVRDKFSSSKSDVPQPLFVIDGVVADKKMEDLDPDEIESIDVLKGKEAISIYGEKAKIHQTYKQGLHV